MIRIQKGTKDVLPYESYKWHFLEEKIRETARLFGLKEIRTPVFEATELFARGVGSTTDIVNKEMYTFDDKGGRSITLKPEGTAGVARSFIENGLDSQPLPLKMYYITPVFRYERPQSGRLREHHQFGIEYYGSASASSDAEVIAVAKSLFDKLNITDITLNINNIGCGVCRKEYNAVLTEYLRAYEADLCPLCRERMQKNPLRVLDCKEEGCKKITASAPRTLEYLCPECDTHFKKLQEYLTAYGIEFVVNPNVVRGLDYYTGTVFEFISNNIGAQGTVCGGGRYNNMLEELGGKPTPVVGFGLGLERLLLVAESSGAEITAPPAPLIYIAPLDGSLTGYALNLASQIRKAGISCETDCMGRSLKAQMKYADKAGFRFAAVLGSDEISANRIVLKDMTGSADGKEVPLDKLTEYLLSIG